MRFTLTLICDDYDPDALDLFDESNTLTLDSFERRGWGKTVNEISVVYQDRDDNTDKTITVHDIGNIQIQGGVVTQTVQYPGISNADLAARVALRDLRAAASPSTAPGGIWGAVIPLNFPGQNWASIQRCTE